MHISAQILDEQNDDVILITISDDLDKVIFDGKWTFETEWKRSSWDRLSYENNLIHLRTAHQGNFIYVMIDAVQDTDLDEGMDQAIVCIDSNNDKSLSPKNDDYCFVATLEKKGIFDIILGSDNGLVIQGDTSSGEYKNFKEISVNEFIGISTVSDENDRYSKIPHASYEFRIPTDLVGRSDNYGFFVSIYDHSSQKFYNWPIESNRSDIFEIPAPSEWGDLVSPDKSIPEFEWPLFTLIPALLFFTVLTKLKKSLFINNKF